MFWYSGLWRIRSAVPASGAWRRMRLSHDCLVSSIAAHSSPLGFTPASANASSGTRAATLPNAPTPSASASRLAGSTVSTRTFPPWRTAAIAAAAAAVVVLPTPPEPHAITISCDTSSCSIDPERRSGISVPQLGGEGIGDHARRAQAVGPGEQVRHVQQGQLGGDPVAEALEMGGPGAPKRHGQTGGVEQRPDIAPDRDVDPLARGIAQSRSEERRVG